MKNNNRKPRNMGSILLYVILFGMVVLAAWWWTNSSVPAAADAKELEFSEFVGILENKEVRTLNVSDSSRKYTGELKDGTHFVTYAPSAYDMAVISQEYIIPLCTEDSGFTVESVKPSNAGAIMSWLPTLLLIAVMIFFWYNLLGSQGGGKGMMNFGKSRAKMFESGNTKVTFKDIAGLDEEKQELTEVVDFLKNPKKYTELGARIPKGILLVGPPGTGKTYISKAVAGEAGVPFFSISGSDFVEMFVGVGASRVRDLFAEAKKNSPCIVFIDEIDAVGRRRGAGIGGGNDEREQTLNQLLVEMDGFGVNEGIIVLAATNRPDVLDPAILRPGRFDREVTIGTPDINGREAVFKVHSKNKPIGKDVNLKTLAKRTPGFTPADIENMMNEAALLTARRDGSEIHMDDLEEAITRVIAGPKKKSRVMSETEKKLTAFHEAGHAIVAKYTPGSDPVHQITIMPRGRAGGFTMTLPEEDKYYRTKTDMMSAIKHLLGGRIAEALVMGDISTGASNDLERTTQIAHDMVAKYGMTDTLGPINYSSGEEVFLGRDFSSKQNFSEELASKIDAEIRKIVDSCYADAEQLLKDHMDQLTVVANALLEMETIDGDQFNALCDGTKTIEQIKAEAEEELAVRNEAEKREAEEKAKRDAEMRQKQEAELKDAMDKGRRVAIIDENGKMIIKDAAEFRKEQEEASRAASGNSETTEAGETNETEEGDK